MAIFKKKSEKETSVVPAETTAPKTVAMPRTLKAVILRPRITEKAGMKSEMGTYAFEVASDANKLSIAKAVEEIYKVTPVKVNIVNLPRKKVFARGKRGMKKAVRKAYVYLKEGDKIEFI